MDISNWSETAKLVSPFAIVLIGFIGKRMEARRDRDRQIDQERFETKVRLDDLERRLGRFEKHHGDEA